MHTKIGIIGLGAIGSVIAKSLHANGNIKLKYYTRTPTEELRIKHHNDVIRIPIKCEKTNNSKGNLDWVIICLKAHQFNSAHDVFSQLIGPKTKVVIIRNGIDLIDDLLPFQKHKLILPCMIDCPVQPQEDGYYLQFKTPVITTPKSQLSAAFEKLFISNDVVINHTDDFNTESWKKLIESASIGALQCLTGKTSVIFKEPKIRNVLSQLINEGISVGTSTGAKIEHAFKEGLLIKIKNYPINKGSSMLTDMKLGHEIELEAKNGAILKVAKSNNIKVPLNELFCTLLAQINRP